MTSTQMIAPAPAPEWVRVAAELEQLDAGIERDSLRRADLAHRLYVAWVAARSPGGSFVRAIDDHRQSQGLRRWGNQLYAWRDAGEARARGIKAPTAGEAAAAGQALREALQGSTVQDAVQSVQQRVDAGDFRKRRGAPDAPQGCTWTAVPVSAAETLDAVLQRIAERAEVLREDWPTEKPERLAAVIESLSEHPELGDAVLRPDDYIVLERESALELRRLALIGRDAESGNRNGSVS